MKKTLKYLLVLIVSAVLCLSFNYCNAVDLNLTENTTSTNSSNTASNFTTNSTTNTSSTAKSNTTSSTTVSSVSSIPESNLGLSNILSILLATVGIIIIFLGIAILIKLNQ